MGNNRFFEYVKRGYGRFPLLFQTLMWLLFIFLPYSTSLLQFFNPHIIWRVFGIKVLTDTFGIAFFYVNYHVLTPDILKNGRPYRLGIALFAVIVLLIGINELYYRFFLRADLDQLINHFVQSNERRLKAQKLLNVPSISIVYPVLSLILLASISTGLAVYKDRNQHKSQHQQIIIEKQEAELSALKLQISPHFLFNTLNNMRWLARQKSDATEDAIQRLSDMLRYMIYQANGGPVALAQEVEYLTDYIKLQQLRLAPHNQVIFETKIDNDRVLIEPLLLIHFVENAFKYGMHHELESTVMIYLRIEQGSLFFSIRNSLFVKKLTDDSGIGIQNVVRRLALHYPDRHTLRTGPRDGQFCVDLQIDLSY